MLPKNRNFIECEAKEFSTSYLNTLIGSKLRFEQFHLVIQFFQLIRLGINLCF